VNLMAPQWHCAEWIVWSAGEVSSTTVKMEKSSGLSSLEGTIAFAGRKEISGKEQIEEGMVFKKSISIYARYETSKA